MLDPSVVFLNHGSFGACPETVLRVQSDLRARMEAEPVAFFVDELPARLDGARERLAMFVGAKPSNLVFVRNATAAVNAVVRSFPLREGDEILTTNHAYRACVNALGVAADHAGASVRVADVPFPITSASVVVDAVLAALGPKTRLALLDHVTSPTGLVFPVAELVSALEARGVAVLVDGAHGPGMLPLELEVLGASFYTGNLHKWVCAPKGAAFLWARPDRQAALLPTSVSHGRSLPDGVRPKLWLDFDWTGTDDPTPWLAVPAALDFLEALTPGGARALMRGNHERALAGRRILCDALRVALPAPDDMLGALAAVPLPDAPRSSIPRSPLDADPLQARLRARHRVQVPIVPWPRYPHRLVRISMQAYNTPRDVELLAEALLAELSP